MKYLKAGRFRPAFFMACFFCHSLQAACLITEQDKHRALVISSDRLKAIDGDSLKLLPGERQLRLIGLNTPEYKEPLANKAKVALAELIKSSKQLYWLKGEQVQDGYGRYLSHLFLSNGRSVEAVLLRRGLGFLVAMPPNLHYLGCLAAQQKVARQSKLGVWGEPYFRAIDLSSKQQVKRLSGGFKRIKAKLMSFRQSKQGWWLELGGDVVLRIGRRNQAYFDKAELKALIGNRMIVSGWVVDRRKQKSLKKGGHASYLLWLTHPQHIEWLAEN